MKKFFQQISKRRIALLLSLVAILIISSIGLAMRSDGDHDTTGQNSFYSAGLVASAPVHDSGDYLYIQKIGVDVPIMMSVDGGNKTKYNDALKKGVAHMKGTAEAGENGNVFIFGHSSGLQSYGDFRAIFARLNELEKDDEIIIFSGGDKYKYIVDDKKVVAPTYTESTKQDKKVKKLTLMTCWPVGTNAKRLIVMAQLEN